MKELKTEGLQREIFSFYLIVIILKIQNNLLL